MSQHGFAVMVRQLLGREDIFPFRLAGCRAAEGAIKGVNCQRAVDFHRFLLVAVVEHHAATESTDAGLAGLTENRMSPDRNDAIGYDRFRFLCE